MDFIPSIPIWFLMILIFFCRIADVSLGTLRTIAIVQGYLKLAVVLGFFEVLIWISIISQVITRLHESPWLIFAFAGGFAAGNGVGMAIEKRMALGLCLVTMISSVSGDAIACRLRELGQALTTVMGQGRSGPVTLLYLSCRRRQLGRFLAEARAIDPAVFYTVEPVREWSRDVGSAVAVSRPRPS